MRIRVLLVVISIFLGFLSACEDKDPIVTTGGITGIVTEDGSKKPIVGVEVSDGNETLKTGSDGKYEFTDLEETTYTVTVKKSGYISDSKQITVKAGKISECNFSLVRDVPKIKVDPPLLDFGDDGKQMTFSITNENFKTEMSWLIEIPDDTEWLSVSKKSGTLKVGKEVISVSVDRSKMTEAKNYSVNLVVKSTNGGGSASVTVTASKIAAKLSVTPNVLDFGSKETAMNFTIENKTAGTILSWTAEIPEEIQWLSLSESAGSVETSKEITATVDKSKLTESKTYTTTIKIKDNNSNDVETIVVTVVKDAPKLRVTPENVDFGTEQEKMTFTIMNANTSAPMDWQIEKPESATWLSLSATDGTALTEGETVITLTVDRSKMPDAKNYSTNLVVKSTNGGGSANVAVTASKIASKLSVTPNVLDFGSKETAMNFTIENKTAGTILSWTAEIPEEIQWLSLSESAGSVETSKEITATVDKSKLTESKSYTTTIKVKDNNSNDVETIVVTVVKDAPKLRVTPENVDFGTEQEKMTFTIMNANTSAPMDWQIEKPESATWLSLSATDGTALATGDKVITLTVDRNKMPDEKKYSTSLIVKSTNGGGSVTINVAAEKQGAYLKAEPKALSFGTNQSEKTILVSNSTQTGTITFTSKANESWITVANGSGSITDTQTESIKISVSRLDLSAGDYNGTVVISSNKNTVTINVAMKVLAKQAPTVTSLQSTEVKHNSVAVSAYISSVGSAAISAYGFCWGTNPKPTTADNKTNLGGTSTEKSFNSTISGLTPSTQYYIRAYAINEEGTSYSNAINTTTLSPPTMAVVRTFAADNVKYNSAAGNGSIDDLGDGYVTAYGFCYSKTNPNPSLSDKSMSIGSTTSTGNFSGSITELEEQTKYFVRAYATNSKGTAYGATVEFTTPIAPPLVTGGLLAYYTFDNSNCDDYFNEVNYNGILQGTGAAPTFTTDIPGSAGKSMKCTKGKYYYLTMAPDQSVNDYSYSVWVKTNSTGIIYRNIKVGYGGGYGIGVGFINNKVAYDMDAVIRNNSQHFQIDLSTILFDGKWHQVVITRKGYYVKLYIDGRYYEQNSYDLNRGKTAYIGYSYMGSMDNLRIYNRALTQEEIKEIYKAKQ